MGPQNHHGEPHVFHTLQSSVAGRFGKSICLFEPCNVRQPAQCPSPLSVAYAGLWVRIACSTCTCCGPVEHDRVTTLRQSNMEAHGGRIYLPYPTVLCSMYYIPYTICRILSIPAIHTISYLGLRNLWLALRALKVGNPQHPDPGELAQVDA